MSRFIPAKLIVYLLTGSLGGLLFCRLVDSIAFHDGQHLDQTLAGIWILRFLAAVFGATAMILVPLHIILNRPHVREVQKSWATGTIDPEMLPLFWKHIFYVNYGALPKWIYLPFLILAMILAVIFVLLVFAFLLLALTWAILRMYGLYLHWLGT